VALRLAECSSRFPGSTGQCRGGATNLTDARPLKLEGADDWIMLLGILRS
jgi:hypothetical protein